MINPNNPATWLKPDEKLMCGKYDVAWMYIIFADINDYEGYKVDSEGKIWTCWERCEAFSVGPQREMINEWKLLKLTPGNHGYLTVGLRKDGEAKQFLVHRLVLENLYGPPFGPKFVCEGRHLNGRDHDNRLSNLQWGTPKINQADRVRHGTSNRGERQWKSKLTEKDVLEIVERYKNGERSIDLAKEFNTVQDNIICILTGENWSHVTGITESIGRRTRIGLNSSLSKQDILDIMEMRKVGIKNGLIAKKYKVEIYIIQRIFSGHTWSHVTGIKKG